MNQFFLTNYTIFFLENLAFRKKLQMQLFFAEFSQILLPCRHLLQDILGSFGISVHKKLLNFEIFEKLPL